MADDRPADAYTRFLKSLPPDEVPEVVAAMQGVFNSWFQRAMIEALPNLMKSARGAGMTKEAAGLPHLLAARSNDSRGNVLTKALTLYGLALDAREKGNRLAILSPDDEIVHDVVGFETEPSVQEAAS